ncbi:acrosomal protein KIAA1210 homolog [Cavia porcellus]|uniref:acrosomal protein KIAA1210 homolog n=1 Tax=Cavia porcellus TaxID=10141 RepID=UPI002FDFD709
MTDSASEVSVNLDTLEVSDEGKKKSKFKAFKSFFIKKKKKESEEPQDPRLLKSSLSSSSINISVLELCLEDELTDPRSKSSMGSKSLSHDSIFMFNTESESASEMFLTEFQGRKTLRRSQAFRTLPRTGPSSRSMIGFVPRSGIWVAGSKISEIPPLRPRQPSLSPPLIRAEEISKDIENMSIDDNLPKSPQTNTSSQMILTAKKSFSEPSSGPDHSQSSTACALLSSAQQLAAFSNPDISQSCLDSSAAQPKMALKLWKQQKKSLEETVESKEEEPNLPVACEGEESPTKAKETDLKKVKIENTEYSDQEQSNNAEIHNQNTTDKTKNLASTAYSKSHKTTGMCVSLINEYGSKGRSLLQSGKMQSPSIRGMSLSTSQTSRNPSSWHLLSEKQVVEQLAVSQAEITTPLEMLSDESDMTRRDAGVDFEGKKASVPQLIPEDIQESLVSGPQLYHEDGATVANKTESVTPLTIVGRPCITPKDGVLSVTTEVQVFRDPSPNQSEEEEASPSLGLQNAQSETENIPTVCKEEPLGNVLQACIVRVSDMTNIITEEGGISMENPETANVSPDSDSKSMLEKESDSEKQPAKPNDKQKVFQRSENLVVNLSSVEQQLALGDSSQPEAEKDSSESESASDRESGSQEVDPAHSSQSSGKDEGILSESRSFVVEQLAPRCPSEAVLESKDKEISTESNSSVEKYNAEDWHSSGNALTLSCRNQALEKPADQPEELSDPENTLKKQEPSKCLTPSVMTPVVQQHISYSSMSVCAAQRGSVDPVTPSRLFQPWVNSKFVRLFSANQESTMEWGSFVEPLSHRMTSNYLMNPKTEQKSSSAPIITSMNEISLEVLPPRYSQSLTRAVDEQEASAYPESTPNERQICAALRNPSLPFQQWLNPQREQVFSSLESPAMEEGRVFVDALLPGHSSQPLMNPIVQQSTSLGSESVAAEVISVEPQYSRHFCPNPQIQPTYSRSTAVEQDSFVEQLPRESNFHPSTKPKFQPQTSLNSASSSAQWCGAVEPAPAKHTCKVWLCPDCKQQAPVSLNSTEDEWDISKKSESHRHVVQPWLKPTLEQASSGPENAAVDWSVSMGPQPPRLPSQSLRRSAVKQPVSTGSVSTSREWGSNLEQMPPRKPFQPWMSSPPEQQVSVGLGSSTTEGNVPMDSEPSTYNSQPVTRPKTKQRISDSMSASEEWTTPMGAFSSRHSFQPWMTPKVQQQVSAGPESVAPERDIHKELPRRPFQTASGQKLQKLSSRFESATVGGGNSEISLSPKNSTYFSVKSKVQEIPSTVGNAPAEESNSKKFLLPNSSSPSFVKFMAQQVFAENPDTYREISMDPLSPDFPSKSCLGPKIKHQVFSDWENADTEESISLKPALKSTGKPADPQGDQSFSEGAAKKWSHSKWQLPPRKACKKVKYKQEVSFLDNSPEERRSSERQRPSRHLPKTLHGSEFLPPAGVVNVHAGWSTAKEHPTHHSQAFGNGEYQQQVYSSSINAAAEGSIFENNPGAWPLTKRQVTPKKNRKHNKGFEDFNKSIPTSAVKLGKITTASTWNVPISEDTYYTEEIFQSGDRNNDGHLYLPAQEGHTENLSGVDLKRMSSLRRRKNEKPGNFTQVFSVPLGPMSYREQQIKRGTSQGLPNTSDSFTMPSTFGEKHQNKAKYEGMPKKQPNYRTLGKSGQQSDCYISDPAWFTMARQKQRGSEVNIPAKETKTRSRAGAKTDTKEPRYGTRPEATQKTPQKGTDSANENQPKKILTSSIHGQGKEQTKSSMPTKSVPVVFADQKMRNTSATGKEMKRSLSLPSGLQRSDELVKSDEAAEPVWFSIAKKKAKAWSRIAGVMH